MSRVEPVLLLAILMVTGCKGDHRSQTNKDDRAAIQASTHAPSDLPMPNTTEQPSEELALGTDSTVKIRVINYSNPTASDGSGKFTATVVEPITTASVTIPAGATATGEVTVQNEVATLELNGIQANGHSYSVTMTDPDADSGESSRAIGNRFLPRTTVTKLSAGSSVEFNTRSPHF